MNELSTKNGLTGRVFLIPKFLVYLEFPEFLRLSCMKRQSSKSFPLYKVIKFCFSEFWLAHSALHSNAHLRNSHLEVFCKKDVRKNSAKFPRKHPCQSLFFNKVAGLLLSSVFQ